MFGKTERLDDQFAETFWAADSLDKAYEDIGAYAESPVAQVFKAGFTELNKLVESADKKDETVSNLSGIDNISRTLRKSTESVLNRLDYRLDFLATVSSNAPFIGLFGTVWGLIHSFVNISQEKSADIAVIAPGIAEALTTTLAGLIVAIPAYIAFHYFSNELRKQEQQLGHLSDRFLNIIKQTFVK